MKIVLLGYLPGKKPAKPSAFTMSSSTGRAPKPSLLSPRNAEEGYMLVPIPSRLPVSLPIASINSCSQKLTFSLITTSTANFAKCSLSCERIFELKVAIAILIKSDLNFST
ncbi:hypothetical protein HanPSC8_Chr16g0724841 [Helianthus annuus]|nr:hypothetical protein HanPSC8_Chr16g0724841 [Helianthus annuus]